MSIQIKTISATYERKANLGNYESANIGATVWADLDPAEDDPSAAFDHCFALAKEHVKKHILAAMKNGEKSA